MSVPLFRRLLFTGLALLLFAVQASPQLPQPTPSPQPRTTEKFVPRLEAVAETRLLMEGLNLSNIRGLENVLKQKPTTVDAWKFGRGQALLIAETGNLLLLRPPKNQGRDTWKMRATELRDSATALARTMAQQDFEGSRTALTQLANVCNRCHQGFQSAVRVVPFRPQQPQP
jgi:hypothetical protein